MTISYEYFEEVDIRLGRIVGVEDFPEARKPSYKLMIDFGEEIGTKTSSVQLVGAYEEEELKGMLVVGVVNFSPKKIGSFVSEVLTLGFKNTAGDGWILVTPSKDSVRVGSRLR